MGNLCDSCFGNQREELIEDIDPETRRQQALEVRIIYLIFELVFFTCMKLGSRTKTTRNGKSWNKRSR